MTDYAQQAYWAAFAVNPDTLNLAAGFYPWSNPVWTVQDIPLSGNHSGKGQGGATSAADYL